MIRLLQTGAGAGMRCCSVIRAGGDAASSCQTFSSGFQPPAQASSHPSVWRTLVSSPQVPAVMSAHLVTTETPERRAASVSPVGVTATSTCWTRARATPAAASVCSACTTARVRPARAANWVTTATPRSATAEVSGDDEAAQKTTSFLRLGIKTSFFESVLSGGCFQGVFATPWAVTPPPVQHPTTATVSAAAVSVAACPT